MSPWFKIAPSVGRKLTNCGEDRRKEEGRRREGRERGGMEAS